VRNDAVLPFVFESGETETAEDLMSGRVVLALAFVGTILCACGTSTSDRAISGGAIGAGAGAVGGALVGAPLAGAALGGAAGAGAGALTSPNQVDLGKPAWK
jgi:hypothetical protein